jgi:ActR/RegA family two-component response regulator
MKALITLAMLFDADSSEEAEELRDNVDRAVWENVRNVLRAHKVNADALAELMTIFPATLALDAAPEPSA